MRREARRQHAAHRVADDEGLVDLQVLQQQARIARHVVEVIWNDRLRRPAEANLIGHDDPKPFLAKCVDGSAPVESGEVHPVKEHDSAAVRLPLRRHVHVGHSDVLAVQRHGQVRDGMWIGHVLARDASRLDVGWRRRRGALRSGRARAQYDQPDRGERKLFFIADNISLISSQAQPSSADRERF